MQSPRAGRPRARKAPREAAKSDEDGTGESPPCGALRIPPATAAHPTVLRFSGSDRRFGRAQARNYSSGTGNRQTSTDPTATFSCLGRLALELHERVEGALGLAGRRTLDGEGEDTFRPVALPRDARRVRRRTWRWLLRGASRRSGAPPSGRPRRATGLSAARAFFLVNVCACAAGASKSAMQATPSHSEPNLFIRLPPCRLLSAHYENRRSGTPLFWTGQRVLKRKRRIASGDPRLCSG